MKMNDLDKLVDLVEKVAEDGSLPASLQPRLAKSRGDIMIGDHSVAELGGQPIGYMNHLMTNRSLPEELKLLVAARTTMAHPSFAEVRLSRQEKQA